ncbi:MAG TPA: histidine triad nucleotide-binding protein [Microthrixaceae bacterium]|nr:histidine triad nucleotide-binding protein [Microthrixaceae bacterium]
MTDAASDCLFCRIVAGEVPAEIVHTDDHTVAFRDIAPQAPTHVLVIPRAHHRDAAALSASTDGGVDALVRAAVKVAEAEGLGDGYRLVLNTGQDGGQTVFHVHLHLLGGRAMTWPPG